MVRLTESQINSIVRKVLNEESSKPFMEFAEKRGMGAAKIADTAHKKGGVSLLTWHHFKVKAPYYKKATEGKFDEENAKKEFSETLKKISLGMSQIWPSLFRSIRQPLAHRD
jgi:hypothetical protein